MQSAHRTAPEGPNLGPHTDLQYEIYLLLFHLTPNYLDMILQADCY